MFYDLGLPAELALPVIVKKTLQKKIRMIIENSLNFDPSSFCNAFAISRKDDETDGDQT